MFKKAVKHESKLRLAISGPAGSGKTYTALAIATSLGGPVAVVDTEHGSASKYADIFEFDVAEMSPPFHPDRFIQAIREAASAGYSTIVLDSISHAWNGSGGLLELVEEAQKRLKSNNSFAAWKDVTPIQNRFVDAIIAAPIHVIATMRSRQKYVAEPDERTNRIIVRKVGMSPIQRDGFEYEFDVFMEMDAEHNAIVSKARHPELDGRVVTKPGADFAAILLNCLCGEPAPKVEAQETQPPKDKFSAHLADFYRRHTEKAQAFASNFNEQVARAWERAATEQPPPSTVEIPEEVRAWQKPEDAYQWAISIGASDNVFAARNAMKSVVDAHGGRLTKDNATLIYTAYYYDRLERAQEKARARSAQPDFEFDAEQNPEQDLADAFTE